MLVLVSCPRIPFQLLTLGLRLLVILCIHESATDAADSTTFLRLTYDGHLKQRPSWSADGSQLVFTRHRGTNIFLYVLSADGKQEQRLTKNDAPECDAVWSPDGKRLAFAFDKTSPGQGDIEIYVIDAGGENQRPIITSPGRLSHEEWPAWSPDGKQLAFTSTRDGNQELYVCAADGSDIRRMTVDPAIDAHPSWSTDGKQIAFTTSRWGDLEIAVINSDGTGLRRVTESRGLDDYPAWSPDGSQLAFTSNRDGNFEIYVTESSGARCQNITVSPAIDNFATWTPHSHLTFVSNRDGGFDIYQTKPLSSP